MRYKATRLWMNKTVNVESVMSCLTAVTQTERGTTNTNINVNRKISQMVITCNRGRGQRERERMMLSMCYATISHEINTAIK